MSQSVKINYYDQFKCIADKCSMTCCQEWRIAVDDETKKKWVGHQIDDVENHTKLSLCNCLEEEETGSIIKLNADKKCPFLNKDKLCKLVIGLDETFLSKTCDTFPRQKNEFENRTEHSLASCCPVVVDLIRKEKPQISREGFVEGNLKIQNQEEALLYEVREMMLGLMDEDTYTLPERLMMIFYTLLELLDQKKFTVAQVKGASGEKQLKPLIKAIRNMEFSLVDALLESNELFLDVVENYRKQGLYVGYLESIAELAEQLEADYEEEELLEKQAEFEKILLEHKQLLKHYIMAEMISNGLMPESSLEDMVVAFEWIVMEYSVIRQALFLKWLEQGEEKLTYEVVRDYITVIARVTGYDASDIYEYLENSFEDVIWEWGYMAMVLGNQEM